VTMEACLTARGRLRPIGKARPYDHLLDEVVWNRLINYIVRDSGVDLTLAGRILDQAVAFLVLVASSGEGAAYSPSPLVDVGWHAFILHTREYNEFCERVAGRFIHHVPMEPNEPNSATHGSADAREALTRAGIEIDEQLWAFKADCGGQKCYGGDCTSGGPPGKAAQVRPSPVVLAIH
jgi:hypothetical protein